MLLLLEGVFIILSILAVGEGGRRCREEGGCHARSEQCILYYITAPYFHAGLPFIIGDKRLKEGIEKVARSDVKAKMNSTRQNPASIRQREEHVVYMNKITSAHKVHII